MSAMVPGGFRSFDLSVDHQRSHEINQNKCSFFLLGFQVGGATLMFFMCILAMYISDDPKTGVLQELSEAYYPVYRGLFLLSFFFVCYGLDLFIWHQFKINYETIFHIKSKHNYKLVIQTSASYMLVMCTTFVLYVLSISDVSSVKGKDIWPLSAVVISLCVLFSPYNLPFTQNRSARYRMLRTTVKVLAAPFTKVTFARIFAADVLTSMPRIFNDIQYTACIYATGEAFDQSWNKTTRHFEREEHCVAKGSDIYYSIRVVLALLPFWIRLMQCVRLFWDSRSPKHLANALKYSMSLAVISLSFTRFTYVWVVVGVLSTAYAFTWDLLMDWGLGPACIRRRLHGTYFGRPSRWCMLRPIHLYPRWVYYLAMYTNGVARCGWAIVISPGQKLLRQHVVLLFGCMELMRRGQWALLRMEWEYIHRSFGPGRTPSKDQPVRCVSGSTMQDSQNGEYRFSQTGSLSS